MDSIQSGHMNNNAIEKICAHFDLGTPIKHAQRVHGGLLHLMWRIDTDKASYAIKQLSKDMDLTDERVIKNYEVSERIASHFVAHGVPAVSAIEKSGKYLVIIDGTGFLVYPWVDAKALDEHAISENHALKIAQVLAKMHAINLNVPEITNPEFNPITLEQILALIDKAEKFLCPFSAALRKNQKNILAANEAYLNAVPVLRAHVVVSHGDLDQKNILWDSNNNPILIDWESSFHKINPTYDIINTAFYWSGITTNFNKELFFKIINAYQKAGGVINTKQVEAAFYGTFTWIGWLVYNIERSCAKGESENKTTGIEQVNQTLATILRLQALIPALIRSFSDGRRA
jgi:thiamine kinase-like enzyme